jgi:excisionase family DNA binding protein
MDDMMRVADVAPRVGLTRQALFAACRNGQFPHVRIGRRIRIPASGLERWIEEQLAKNQKPASARAEA